MNLVLTNWKAAFLKEKRSLLLMAVALSGYGYIMWAGGSFELNEIRYFLGFILFIWPGSTVLRLQGELLLKPMSFCLPGHRESLRILNFSGAIIFGLGLSLALMPFYRHPTSVEIGLNVTGGFLAGAVLCLMLGATRLVVSSLALGVLYLLSIPLAIVAYAMVAMAHDEPLVFWPLFIPVYIAICAFFWSRLGDMRHVKRGHRNILGDATERRASVEIGRMTTPRVQEWFRSQVERRDYLSAARYVWADLYVTLGPTFQYWKWMLALLVVITLAVGHLVGVALASGDTRQWEVAILFTALGAAAGALRTPLTSTMLLPGGRRERCYAAVATGMASSLLLVAVALAVAALSWFFALFLAGTPAKGQRLSYAAIHPGSAFLACLLVPWFLALRLLGYKVRFLKRIDWIVFIAVMVLLSPIMLAIQTWSDGARYMLLGGVLVGGWLCFLLVLRLAARHWSIGGQR